MKTKLNRLVRVRALDAYSACVGCVFGDVYSCRMPMDDENLRRARRCITPLSVVPPRNYIFIEPTKPARAAYLALVLKHGTEQ